MNKRERQIELLNTIGNGISYALYSTYKKKCNNDIEIYKKKLHKLELIELIEKEIKSNLKKNGTIDKELLDRLIDKNGLDVSHGEFFSFTRRKEDTRKFYEDRINKLQSVKKIKEILLSEFGSD